ncbi:hypothetical protein LSTR_LSTR004307 [Laodelphax striatellus]|uniref:CHCH domain-containing protein n=1 Tax=Laodelphax striatellus TaxID=195883 RepID=A0A482X9L6_LAOST|nr:hypothetical protein LSTR_LSTR004307 [Laodelphax striatellus]
MKTTATVFKRINYPTTPVPFEQYLPLKLKNYVSGKGQQSESRKCTNEMFILLGCLKKHEYENKECLKEAKQFQDCVKFFSEEKKKHIELVKTGSLTPGAKKLTHTQLNILLKRYPNPK